MFYFLQKRVCFRLLFDKICMEVHVIDNINEKWVTPHDLGKRQTFWEAIESQRITDSGSEGIHGLIKFRTYLGDKPGESELGQKQQVLQQENGCQARLDRPPPSIVVQAHQQCTICDDCNHSQVLPSPPPTTWIDQSVRLVTVWGDFALRIELDILRNPGCSRFKVIGFNAQLL